MLIQSSRRIQAPKLERAATAQSETEAPAEVREADSPQVDQPLSGDAGKRVGHFVRGVTLESLQHLRYLSAASAFQKVGSTLGSVGFTPLAIKLASDNAPLIGGLAIGGTVAAGAIGAVAGYAWQYHQDGKAEKVQKDASAFSKIADTVLDIGGALQALPKFVYPSVVGATDAQREVIYNALDQLPLHQATASATIEVVPNLLDTGISGMAQPGDSHVHLLLDSSRLDNVKWGTELVWHEQGHAVDYSGGFGLLGSHNWKGGFGTGPFVSDYASTNRYEDFAESFEAYRADPEGFAAKFPEKAEALEKLSHSDPVTSAFDRPSVRRSGRRIGETLGKVPYLRTGLELAGSLIAPIQIHRGASKLAEGLQTGDEQKKLDGKLNLASGLFLSLPGARPLALATSVAGGAIRATSMEKNGEHLSTANHMADAVLTTSAGPVGMTLAAVAQELKANGMSLDASSGFAPDGWTAARPSKGAMLKGTLSTVGGTVLGAMAGAAAGAALAGTTGAVAGAVWGQVAGGAIGLAGYSIHRTLSQKSELGDPLALTASDKKFLKGMISGAVVGGAAGTAGGVLAGHFLGSLAGQALGGPGTATILGNVGGWVGALSGAFGGAKLGAGVGSGRYFGSPLNERAESWKDLVK